MSEPTAADAEAFRRGAEGTGFSYTEIGHSAGGRPAGYVIDHNRVRLGEGEAIAGPSIVVEYSATAWIPPGWIARALADGSVEVVRDGASNALSDAGRNSRAGS